MSAPEPTPGPWRVEDWSYSQPGREHVPTIVNGSDAIAQALGLWRDGADDTDERNANANLIAAAWELLEIVKVLEEWYAERGGGPGASALCFADDEPMAVHVRAAIAKAEGRTP